MIIERVEPRRGITYPPYLKVLKTDLLNRASDDIRNREL